jgi:predicted acylesterase/phospholipase RssA
MKLRQTATLRSSAVGGVLCVWVIAAVLLQGCTSLPERNPLPEERYAQSRVLGLTNLRFWGDDEPPMGSGLEEPTVEAFKSRFPALVGQELHFLAISGGGENGAFAAGLLNGWTAHGSRPEFTMVTGVSAGALIAPFAYLGPDYDNHVAGFFTRYSSEDLIEQRGLLKVLRTDAGFDTAGLRTRIAHYIDEPVMAAIAAEYRRGRLLFIGTTNLDAGRAVTWDIGAIASSGKPAALDLIRNIILASVSIPVAFPPVLIEVEADGQLYDEMHVDGGVARQSFLFHLSGNEDTFRNLEVVGRGQAYVIRNSKLESDWEAVDRKLIAIAGRSASSMVRSQGIGDLYREYLGAQKFDFDFNLAYIPDTFHAGSHEFFDLDYMRRLYEFGYEMAADGFPWVDSPPALKEQ